MKLGPANRDRTVAVAVAAEADGAAADMAAVVAVAEAAAIATGKPFPSPQGRFVGRNFLGGSFPSMAKGPPSTLGILAFGGSSGTP